MMKPNEKSGEVQDTGAYKDLFSREELARAYDSREYAPRSGSALQWEMERPFLEKLLSASPGADRWDCLDFACGTGRITAILEKQAGRVTGMDINEAMLEVARGKVSRASLVCGNFEEAGHSEIRDCHDLVTSFRFLPNVEPDIAERAVRWWFQVLKPGGMLVVNSHLNPVSFKALLLPWHALRRWLGQKGGARYLGSRRMRQMLEGAGFRVEQVYGLGLLSGRLVPLLPWKAALALESAFAGSAVARRFGCNLVFVCRKPL